MKRLAIKHGQSCPSVIMVGELDKCKSFALIRVEVSRYGNL